MIIGLVWPLSWKKNIQNEHLGTLAFWTASCLATCVFPLLSVDKDENLVTMWVVSCKECENVTKFLLFCVIEVSQEVAPSS